MGGGREASAGEQCHPLAPVREWIPKPSPESMRVLTSTPPPYSHPRIVFSREDHAELVRRALGEEDSSPGPGAVGRVSFARLEAWVEEEVYGTPEDHPVRRILQVVASGREPPPGGQDLCPREGDFPKSTGSEEKAAKDVFEELCKLVSDPGEGGAASAPKVLYGTLYSQLFKKVLAPCSLGDAVKTFGLVKPGQSDTSPELGVKLLFTTSEGGVPGVTSPVYRALETAAYVAWIRGHSARLEWLGTVLCMAARVQLLWYAVPGPETLNKHGGGVVGWDREDGSVCSHLAMAYDVLFDSLSQAQAMAPRRLLLSMGRRRVMTGFDAQSYRTCTGPGIDNLGTAGTFQVMTSVLLLVQYAVEGESVEGGCGGDEGGKDLPALEYDAEAAGFNVQGLKFWFTYGTAADPAGTTREGPGYFNTAAKAASITALAAARRGHRVFEETNFYAVLSEVIQTMTKCFDLYGVWGAHDGIGFCGGPGQSEYLLVIKYMFPEDPLVNFVYQKINTSCTGQIAMAGVDRMPLPSAMFGLDVPQELITFQAVSEAAHLPLSFFSNFRGMGTVRSAWDESGVLLWFESRADMYNLGHGHSNRNDFYMAALGRLWVSVGQYHNTANEAHSTVLIDGVGQGGCHTSKVTPECLARRWSHVPGKVVESFDSEQLAGFMGDATVAYTFVTDGPNGPRPSPKATLETPYMWKDFFSYVPDFGPSLWKDKATGKPVWKVDHSWADRKMRVGAEFNPVEHALRTVGLVRGIRSFVLVVDDIKKDENPHTWTWVANTTIPYFSGRGYSKPVSILDTSEHGLNPATDAIFVRGEDLDPTSGKPQVGCPLLLLRVLQGEGSASGPVRLVHVPKGFPAHLDCSASSEYHRIEIERSGTVEPKFKIMLFPFFEGETLPQTSWDGERLSVRWDSPDGSQCHDLVFPKLDRGIRIQML